MAIISSLQSGIPLNSTGNLLKPGEVTITDPNGFFPLYSTTGQLQTGGLYATMFVGLGTPGTINTIVAGQALTLSIEYNNQGQFRYNVTPIGGYTLSSAFLATNMEHSVGVSYDTTTGLTILSVDGASQSAYASYTTTGTSALVAGKTIASSLNGSVSNPSTFNGYLDQFAIFAVAPTAGALNILTNDPLGANTAFYNAQTTGNPVGHIESQTVSFATVATAKAAAAAAQNVFTINSLSGIQYGDIVTDPTTAGVIPAGDFVTQVSGNSVTLNAALTGVGIKASDVLVFTHPSSITTTSPLVASTATQTITIGAATGVMAGDTVSGYNIPANDTVSSIAGAASIVLSTAVGSNVAGSSNLTFTHPPASYNVTATVPAGTTPTSSANQTLASSIGVAVGDVVIGTNVPNYDHVIAINGAAITLSQSITTNTAQTLTFVHSTMATTPSTTALVAGAAALVTVNMAAASLIGNIQIGDIITDTTNNTSFVNDTVINFNPATGAMTLSSPAAVSTNGATDALTFTHTTSTTTTGTANTAGTSLSLTSGLGVQAGDIVIDVTKNANTVNANSGITVSNVSGNLVTLSAALAGSFTNDTLTFVHPPIATVQATTSSTYTPTLIAGTSNTTIGYQTAVGTSFLVYSLAGIQAGDLVFGPGIPAGDTVASTWTPIVSTAAVTLTTATTSQIPANSSIQFVHPTNPNVQIITLNSTATAAGATSYKAGDTLAVTAYLNANTPVTRTYTVSSTDVGTTPALTQANIAASFVLANPVIGAFNVIKGPSPGTIELVPMNNTPMPLPAATVTDVNSFGIDENTVSQYYNFYKVTTASNTFTGANSLYQAALTDSTGANTPTAISISYSTSSSTSTATKQAHGPVYAELASIAGLNVTYNLFVDPSLAPNPTLNSVGLTINVPTAQATINNLLPGAGGTITQVNTAVSGAVTYQWLSNLGVTDFTKPVAQLQLTLASSSTNIINATMTNLSVNNTNFKDPVQSVPMLVGTDLNSQVYSLSGHFYQQYNPANGATLPFGNTTSGSPWNQSLTQLPIPMQDFSYTVQGYGTNSLYFSVENTNLTPVTRANPNATVNLDLMALNMSTTASKLPFSVTVDVPSNASNVFFTAGTGVTLTSNTATTGHTLVLTGTYTAPTGKGAVASSTPMLGILTATLSNEFNNGSQFSMDTVTINGAAASGQSLYFGMGEADAAGVYSINNIPAGMLTVTPFNNVAAINPRNISVNDALAVLSIAAGKGIPPGAGQLVGAAANILPSDFVASDFNMDGQITAADALSILNYIVSVNKANLTPSFSYMPAVADTTTYTYLPPGATATTTPLKETVTAVVPPPLSAVASDKNAANTALTTGDATKILDIIGVLPGDVVNF